MRLNLGWMYDRPLRLRSDLEGGGAPPVSAAETLITYQTLKADKSRFTAAFTVRAGQLGNIRVTVWAGSRRRPPPRRSRSWTQPRAFRLKTETNKARSPETLGKLCRYLDIHTATLPWPKSCPSPLWCSKPWHRTRQDAVTFHTGLHHRHGWYGTGTVRVRCSRGTGVRYGTGFFRTRTTVPTCVPLLPCCIPTLCVFVDEPFVFE